MALDWGPERAVCWPGVRARDESREVAKVSVTKGVLLLFSASMAALGGGRWGPRKALSESGNSKASLGFDDAMVAVNCSKIEAARA